ncbi:hypothetical protein DFS33DRAFT_1276890 [Desarmillaria ectypa]|nr:hypothetical protein DFS33DRAFT_1276890 [Desarmillaria ectypa]
MAASVYLLPSVYLKLATCSQSFRKRGDSSTTLQWLTSVPITTPTTFPRTLSFSSPTSMLAKMQGRDPAAHLSAIVQYCPCGAGEAVVTKIEHRKSLPPSEYQYLLCYVKDRRNISGREAIIRIKRTFKTGHPQTSQEGLPGPSTARDIFTINCTPEIMPNDDSRLVAKPEFKELSLTSEQLAAAAAVVSDYYERHNIANYQ